MHTNMHTLMQTNIHTLIHTNMHTLMQQTCIHSCNKHAYTHAYTHATNTDPPLRAVMSAAHRHAVSARNEGFHNSLRQLFATPSGHSRRVGPGKPPSSPVLQHDHLIWLGDLNYRMFVCVCVCVRLDKRPAWTQVRACLQHYRTDSARGAGSHRCKCL